ncbi:hypothetical protein KKB55_19965, partial [Myxococcota bacterium]|nr:hypothetical protein [Myxococcota bacterium]
ARATLDALSARLEGDAAPAAAPPSPPPAVEARPAPWAWSITADQGGDRDYVDWVDIAQAIHNGHTTGHRCPYCSEPLEAIERRDPYIRVYCTVCGEGFEGKLA